MYQLASISPKHHFVTFVTLPSIHRFKKILNVELNNKSFLIWLLITPPHLKYVATLPCNLSLTACRAETNVSQGKVATYARCGGIFNNLFTANLLQNLPVIFLSWLMFDRIRVCGLVFGPPCMWNVKLIRKVNKVKQLRLQMNDVTHN